MPPPLNAGAAPCRLRTGTRRVGEDPIAIPGGAMLTGIRFTRVVLVAVALSVVGGVPTSAVARSRPIPAEPNVAYATYWGGSGGEGCGPTRGADGSLYVTCGTDSPNLPRVGGIQSYQGQEDGYVAKLDRTGTRIVYATYLGSPGQDEIDSAAVDARGHLYVSGFAANGFPTTPGAYDTTFNGAADCCGGLLGDSARARPRRQRRDRRQDRLGRFPDDRWSGRVDVPGWHGDVRGRAGRRLCRQAQPVRVATRLLDLPGRLR